MNKWEETNLRSTPALPYLLTSRELRFPPSSIVPLMIRCCRQLKNHRWEIITLKENCYRSFKNESCNINRKLNWKYYQRQPTKPTYITEGACCCCGVRHSLHQIKRTDGTVAFHITHWFPASTVRCSNIFRVQERYLFGKPTLQYDIWKTVKTITYLKRYRGMFNFNTTWICVDCIFLIRCFCHFRFIRRTRSKRLSRFINPFDRIVRELRIIQPNFALEIGPTSFTYKIERHAFPPQNNSKQREKQIKNVLHNNNKSK